MDRMKTLLHHMLYPALIVKIILTPLAAGMLTYTFLYIRDNQIFSYVSYVFSAYIFAVLTLGFPSVFRRCKAALYTNPYTGAYLRDAQLRAIVSLYIGFCFNIIYAIFTLYSCISFSSPWFGAIALYYLVLSTIRFNMLSKVRNHEKKKDTDMPIIKQLRQYRFSGYLLLVVAVTMTGVMIQMIRHNQSYQYPGYMIYASALYVFYHLAQAMFNTVRFHRSGNLALSAVKMYDLAVALMAVLALESAMFSRFGSNAIFKQYMMGATSVVVCAAVLYMAILIIVRANQEIKKERINIS